MTISIKTKLLIMCIGLVLFVTIGISTTYYILTRQDKQQESRERIQIAFEILYDDVTNRSEDYLTKLNAFLRQDTSIPWLTFSYFQQELQAVTFHSANFLGRLADQLTQFGTAISADRLLLYGVDRRLLIAYHRDEGQQHVGAYATLENGQDSYVPLDDFDQLSDMLNSRRPIPSAPLPNELQEYYQGGIPDTPIITLFREGRRLGFRTVAPVFYNKNTMGVFVGEVFYTQAMVARYALLSKTDVNLFAGQRFSVGTLPAHSALPPDEAPLMPTCEHVLTQQAAPYISVLSIDNQEYYQGQCAFTTSAGRIIGAATVNLSRRIELQRMSRILTAVFTISGAGIVICIVLVFGVLVPRFTAPIITLTNAALLMAKGEDQEHLDISGNDELGSLSRSFVYMQNEIRKKQAALQQFADELEQRVLARTAEIARQKYILDTFMENVPDSIYFKDLEGRFTRANPAHARRLGLESPEDEVGKTDFDFLSAEEARTRLRQEQEIIRSGRPLLMVEEPDVHGTWSLTTKMPLRDEHGIIIGTFGVSTDITRLKQTEEELRHAKDVAEEALQNAEEARAVAEEARIAAERANQAKSDFLANMSHELRTPLNVILGLTQIMTRHPAIPDDEHENLTIIQHSGEHLLNLINSVLDLSKIESGRISVNNTNIDLRALLRELEDMFTGKALQKHLHLTFECADGVPAYIRTDATKLRQVLINLLNNAVKFTDHGGVSLIVTSDELRVKNEEEGRSTNSSLVTLHFSLSDTGPGIAADDIETLFEAFQQTYTGQKAKEGTGLGLAISREFITMLGGEMTVESDVGQGATFRCTLPVTVVHAGDVDASQDSRRVIALEPGQPRYRILVVDDKPANQHLLVRLLRPLGFEVDEADNGERALAVWSETRPHLILMDMRMPVLDGYETARRMKATPEGQATIIIGLTANSFGNEHEQAIEAGCNDVVSKPFREDEIFEVMRKHLGVRYVYEEGRHQQVRSAEQQPVIHADDVRRLPEAIYAHLRQAATTADIDAMQGLVEQIRPVQPALADNVENCVRQFRFDILIQALKEVPHAAD